MTTTTVGREDDVQEAAPNEEGAKEFDAWSALLSGPKDRDGAASLYDAWAETYDETLGAWGYEAPSRVAALVARHLNANDSPPEPIRGPAESGDERLIHDCGCGTGLGGEALVARGLFHLVGTDCSPASLEACRAKAFRRPGGEGDSEGGETLPVYPTTKLHDLEEKLPFDDDRFCATACVGVTSYLNDFASIFGEWIRTTKKRGPIAFTVRTEIWDGEEKAELRAKEIAEDFEKRGMWRLVSKSEKVPYMPGSPWGEGHGVYDLCYRVL